MEVNTFLEFLRVRLYLPRPAMAAITNIAAYKFVPLTDLKEKRGNLLILCKEAGLRGTILLSPEGINLFVAGPQQGIDCLLAELRSWPGMEALEVKVSLSEHQPFNRMLVRLKKEIIAFGVEGIDPGKRTSPKLAPKELKQWLDEGRPVTLLDTRNDYEVKLGTFKNALPIHIDHFRDFPEAVRKLPEGLKEQPIVMFCTGGIRCEKAGPFMEREGFKNIYQLEGGILKYFEECGGAHYDGECFVFDQRVGVDPSLQETDSTQCFNCLSPLTKEEQEDERYIPGQSCPHCYKTSEEARAAALRERNAELLRIINPLPGSAPYDNYKPLTVPERCDRFTLAAFLREVLPHVPVSEWEALEARGLLVNGQKQPATLNTIVRAGERYFQKMPDNIEPPVNASITILHEDEALIVINKPAPLPVHASGRFNRNTVQYILDQLYHPLKPKPAHRLDANTTGLLALTRTRHFGGRLQPQFAKSEVEKVYLVKVSSHPSGDEFICDAPISVGPSEAGAREVDHEEGLEARTEFRVLSRQSDGSAILEARPVTGRTNQIRVHLWDLGMPVVGDPLYLPGRALGTTQTLRVEDPPMCLHSWKLSFRHPLSGHRVTFEALRPGWAQSQ